MRKEQKKVAHARAIACAQATFDRANNAALDERKRACDGAWAAFDIDSSVIQAKVDRTCAAAWAEYDRAIDTAKAEYDRTLMSLSHVDVDSATGRSIARLFGHFDDQETIATGRLVAAAPALLEALIALTTNPHVHLSDIVYGVRDREGLGWDGPAVTAWSKAVMQATDAIKQATEMPDA